MKGVEDGYDAIGFATGAIGAKRRQGEREREAEKERERLYRLTADLKPSLWRRGLALLGIRPA